jgi:hypothetical protein
LLRLPHSLLVVLVCPNLCGRCCLLQLHEVVLCGRSDAACCCCRCCCLLCLKGSAATPGVDNPCIGSSCQLGPLAESHHRHCCCWQVLQQGGL